MPRLTQAARLKLPGATSRAGSSATWATSFTPSRCSAAKSGMRTVAGTPGVRLAPLLSVVRNLSGAELMVVVPETWSNFQ